MRKLTKTTPAPSVLTTEGVKETVAMVTKMTASANPSGEALVFNSAIYAHGTVKAQLMADQHNKCAYCEQSANGDYGCVEHYRPKGGYVSSLAKGSHLKRPGYYWLAYDWNNLLFSCSKCNTTYKRNFFALKDETKRNIAARDVSRETPLVINPYTEDPGSHLRFHEFRAVPAIKDGEEDVIGKTTIEVFQLNDRQDLLDRRREKWEQYRMELCKEKIFKATNQKLGLEYCHATLAALTASSAEFSGMFSNQM